MLAASRSGHENPQALAELSLALQSAGGIPADLADRLLLAADNAWQMNGSVTRLTDALDGMYRITGQNTVSLGELSRGISAARLAAYESACNALNVKLMETRDGVLSLRAPMDVLRELSAAYRQLSDSDPRRTGLLHSVGGGSRAAQLDALLGQWDTYEAMLRQYALGTGSLAAAAEQASDSWEGSLNRLSNTWTATVGNIADSKAVTAAVNGLNSLLSLVERITDRLGSLKTVSLGAGLFATLKNVGRPQRSGPAAVLNMPTMAGVLQDTEVFLSSNVGYTG